ncbi:TIGR03617 family F420-dependent LLM class oxidoreductase [Mycobacterium paraense]|uniref:TIGR03617 family F420-dependent LLM class oxidoreductase n=1 Tax=Mycobacterium paraense TaxID=767916 RepID=UPI000A1498EB|nr:TIGR03617 family F420-dependent LLM class oxidoreductase [Mycobacterium paraense]MCV7443685.1 TIGR03617 family F420-dependent LLM class oxidoreductase [Mycobacterium paraense]ORW47447.1 LLM class F420-dependent oxidoreductase [Mycobacterium paraense]
MEVVASAPAQLGLAEIGLWAARMERIGFEVIHVPETIHDAFMVAAMALAQTTRLTVRTSMALAFPRSPMITAYAAWDLARYSGGRFQLGLATQVRGNIVGRFSVPWSQPALRMREYIEAVLAIFHSFQTGERLDYGGRFYRFDRLQPYFNPGPNPCAPPQIWTGGVNKKMCVLAGELSDGFVCHPTNSHPSILRAQTLPALAEGAGNGRRPAAPLAVVANPQPLMAGTDGELAQLREHRRSELAFLYSTPAYRRQLEFFGFEDVGEALSGMARRDEWADLSKHLTDEVMDRVVPQGTYDDIPAVLTRWYSGLCTGLSLPVTDVPDDVLATLIDRLKVIPTLREQTPGR